MTNLFIPIKMIPDRLKKKVSILFVIIMMTVIDTSMSVVIHNIYKLAKKNDSYDDYCSTELEKDTESYHYEKKFDEKMFFEIMHNLEALRIPKKEDVEYKEYSEKYDNYCKNHYTNYEHHSREKLFHNFKLGVQKLITCLNDGQSKNLKLKNSLKECFGLTFTGCKLCGIINLGSIKNPLKKNRNVKCLNEEKFKVLSCMDDFHVYMPVTDTKNTENSSVDLCKNDDNNTLSEDEKLKQLPPEDINILLKDVISKEHRLNDDTIMSSLFYNYTKFSPLTNLSEVKEDCLFYKRSPKTFSAVKTMYKILPSPTDDIELFRSNINNYVEDTNKEVPDFLTNFIFTYAEINEKSFKKLKKSRRAIGNEFDYITYAIRLLMKEYMPLTHNLWLEERKNLTLYEEDIKFEEEIDI